ncbi:hypothetical protein GCM10009757_00970 [Streptomyces cheonanensis]|uniref:Uncharacterized protein n=1 Tax=Streptomyces cheonanensis TaxID=312720 RepID=A0ABP5G5P3_9ACTN|nr:hypothetical protein [Streptomyces sp. AA0539]
MSRSSAGGDWSLVGESSDPVPGDPEEVATLGRELRQMADAIQQQAGEIEALASVENWNSPTAEEFRDKADGVSDRLRKAFDRYDTAARALGTEVKDYGEDFEHSEYASELHRAQLKADRALSEAEDADQDLRNATNALDALDDDVEDDDPDKTRLEGNQETAENALSSARTLVETAKQIHEDAANAAAGAIREVINNDGMKDSWWDKFRTNVLPDIGTWAGRIAAALGVAALLFGWVPVIGQIITILAITASVVSLFNSVVQYAYGDGSLLDVVLDTIGVASFGVGAAFLRTARATVPGLRATARQAYNAVARRTGNVRQAMATSGIRSNVSGNALRRTIDAMPPRFMSSIPMPSTVRNPLTNIVRRSDPGMRRVIDELAEMPAQVFNRASVQGAVQSFNSHIAGWAATTGIATSAAGISVGKGIWG